MKIGAFEKAWQENPCAESSMPRETKSQFNMYKRCSRYLRFCSSLKHPSGMDSTISNNSVDMHMHELPFSSSSAFLMFFNRR